MANDEQSLVGLPTNVKAYPRVSHVTDYVVAVNGAVLNWAINMTRDGHDPIAYMNAKGDRGTYLHNCIEAMLKGEMRIEDVQAMDRDYVASTVASLDGWRMVGQEIKLWSDTLKVRGTLDYIGYNPEGVLVIRDWKSGKPKRTEIIQLNLYADMVAERMALAVDHLELVYLRKRKPNIVVVPRIYDLGTSVMTLYRNLGD